MGGAHFYVVHFKYDDEDIVMGTTDDTALVYFWEDTGEAFMATFLGGEGGEFCNLDENPNQKGQFVAKFKERPPFTGITKIYRDSTGNIIRKERVMRKYKNNTNPSAIEL